MSKSAFLNSSSLAPIVIQLIIIWTVLIAISAFWNVRNLKDQTIFLATAEARANWDKDHSFRLWATRHGEMYVVKDERAPPDPFLKYLPNRDVTTTDGQLLTLMNPAYMMHQTSEEFEELNGTRGKITGEILLNPANEADPWELTTLKMLKSGTPEIIEISTIGKQPYVRLMRPMFMEQGCMKCHGHLGFKEGDLRGGASVSVPLSRYLAIENQSKNILLGTHGGIWSLGVLVIGFITWRGKKREDVQRIAEEALRETRERYKTLFETNEVSIWHEDLSDVCDALRNIRQDGVTDLRQHLTNNHHIAWDLVGLIKVIHVNEATLKLFGAKTEDELLFHIEKTFGPNAIDIFIEELCAIWDGKKVFRSETVFNTLDGKNIDAIISFRIPETEEGYKSVSITIIDITERKLAEATLQKSEERFRTLYHQSHMGVSLEDYSAVKTLINQLAEDGVTDFHAHFKSHKGDLNEAIKRIRLVAVNDTQLALYGTSSVEEYLRFDSSYVFQNDSEWLQFFLEEISAFAHGEMMFSREIRDTRKDNSTFQLNCISRIVKGREADWAEVITTHEDISERKNFEEHARRAQKMEAVGQLSGGIAHDFNNILGIVMGNLEIIEQLAGDNEKILGRIATARNGAKRGAELTRKLLGFSRKEADGSTVVSLNETIGQFDQLITRSLTVAINIGHHLEDDLWLVNVDPGDLQDAILNISLNARDAMPTGGTLVIETSNKILDDNYAERHPGSTAGEFVMLAITDSGDGMHPDVKEKALEPFFTTKEEGRGSGLGLSMVYGFIKRSGGHINIYSEPGEGTTIRLYFPRAFKEKGKLPFRPEDIDPPGGNETILVVDDEEALADIAVIFLEELGYRTLATNTPKQALKMLTDNADIDLVFTDVIMPGGMDGYQLAIRAREINPSLKVLLTSGFTKRKEFDQKPNNTSYARLSSTLVSKPYTQSELALAVRKALDE
ncbi:MAG: DUF3365 domain-containing protein [Rhodospirillales bacterium]|nr:DUF3365 domain-containing protein [Rhodospirillales bacterium]